MLRGGRGAGMLSYATSMGSQAEMGMNSVERMTEYLDYSSEAPAILPDNRCPFTARSVASSVKSKFSLK
jgi:hypothetical protein